MERNTILVVGFFWPSLCRSAEWKVSSKDFFQSWGFVAALKHLRIPLRYDSPWILYKRIRGRVGALSIEEHLHVVRDGRYLQPLSGKQALVVPWVAWESFWEEARKLGAPNQRVLSKALRVSLQSRSSLGFRKASEFCNAKELDGRQKTLS